MQVPQHAVQNLVRNFLALVHSIEGEEVRDIRFVVKGESDSQRRMQGPTKAQHPNGNAGF
jgi:hypothetical protein